MTYSWIAAARERDGFSLVEAIVTFAILALVISAAVEIVGHGSVRERGDHARMTALAHAQSELARIAATHAVAPGRTEGRFEDGFAWRIVAHPLPTNSATGQALIPYAVTLYILDQGAATGSVQLQSVVLGPPAP